MVCDLWLVDFEKSAVSLSLLYTWIQASYYLPKGIPGCMTIVYRIVNSYLDSEFQAVDSNS